MSYFLQPKRVKYRITLVIVGSLLEVTTSPTSPELTIDVNRWGVLMLLSAIVIITYWVIGMVGYSCRSQDLILQTP
ncbi:hypothetical protein [Candidatus Tisiphia endosymbiont of Sialis lutaria]|uniref:hypothetical protein n=1 Tax=Candidatus Tisiphia endosymbiont of Sialis lutaria TaxID=2029164 RepID=UPI00312CBD6E